MTQSCTSFYNNTEVLTLTGSVTENTKTKPIYEEVQIDNTSQERGYESGLEQLSTTNNQVSIDPKHESISQLEKSWVIICDNIQVLTALLSEDFETEESELEPTDEEMKSDTPQERGRRRSVPPLSAKSINSGWRPANCSVSNVDNHPAPRLADTHSNETRLVRHQERLQDVKPGDSQQPGAAGQGRHVEYERSCLPIPIDVFISVFQQLRKFRRRMSFHWLRYRERFNYVRYDRNDLANLFAQLQQELGYRPGDDKHSDQSKIMRLVDTMDVLNRGIAAEEAKLEDIHADIQREEDLLTDAESRLTGLLELSMSSLGDDDDDGLNDFLKSALSLPISPTNSSAPISLPVLEKAPNLRIIIGSTVSEEGDSTASNSDIEEQQDYARSIGIQFPKDSNLASLNGEAMLDEDVLIPGQTSARSDLWEMVDKPFEFQGLKDSTESLQQMSSSKTKPNMICRMFQGLWESWLGELRLSSLLIDAATWPIMVIRSEPLPMGPPGPRPMTAQSSRQISSTLVISCNSAGSTDIVAEPIKDYSPHIH